MKLGIITYNKPHIKTQNLIYGLIYQGFRDITLFFVPYIKRQKRKVLINHRPEQFTGQSPLVLAKNFYFKYFDIDKKKLMDCDYILIGGANIIDSNFIIKNKIINCHSGLIPQSRGLDSFKWALKKKKLIGNTLHFIDNKIDKGKIISHYLTPVFKNDTLESLSIRHYNYEVFLLINFLTALKKKVIFKLKESSATKRMKIDDEKKIIKNFSQLKNSIIKKQFNYKNHLTG